MVSSQKILFLSLSLLFLMGVSPVSAASYKAGDIYRNQIVVKYKPGQSPIELRQKIQTTKPKTTSFLGKIFSTLSNTQTDEEKLKEIEDLEKKLRIVPLSSGRSSDPSIIVYTVKDASQYKNRITALSNSSKIKYVEPNYILRAFETPNDPFFGSSQWSLKKIQAEKAWDLAKGTTTVKVASIDTGIDLEHPDLKTHIVDAKEFTTDNIIPSDCTTGYDTQDKIGHGSHVAGIIGAVTNNGDGVAGLNWNVSLMSLKVGCDSTFTETGIDKALEYAMNNGAKVINMSFGFRGFSQVLADRLKEAHDKGIVLIAAAGNNEADLGPDADEIFPGNQDTVISVSATGPNDEIASYSSVGTVVDIAAPGGNPSGGSDQCKDDASDCILSTDVSGKSSAGIEKGANNEYLLLSGTSQSAPHVTGVVALMLGIDPTLTVDKIRTLLFTSADDLGTPGKDDQFGNGRLNAFKAIQAITSGVAPTGGPNTTPGAGTGTPVSGSTATPGGAGTVAPTAIGGGGGGGPSVTPVSADCEAKKRLGDYNCDDKVSLKDYTDWSKDYLNVQTTLQYFEFWRSPCYGGKCVSD
ncbi:MAG: S8 family peptidase [Candidatus Roizmanbacteria bacterium]